MQEVPGYSGIFINEDGSTIVSYRRYKAGRVLSPYLCNGRRRVKLGEGQKFVYQLVALTFIGPCPPGMEVRHLDDDFTNDHWTNLAYGTHQENIADSIASGRHASCAEAAKTHCRWGHEYTPDNTRIYRGKRFCRRCNRDQLRIRRGSKLAA
ncbi:HNH endonuclease [Mycobacterium phage Gizmo]|uniref:HNH endonuclease n=1 Tax=Mycobacterium phage Gizmo TaxID=1327936 RepID=R4TL03_9CAUD|nr:HNH endonuclease [Mycobacterium phage Gizmo]AGM13416.1 HNH endonuclease [Mycobacterium phage Gizmo]